MRTLLVALLTATLAGALAGPAVALPGDPPVTPLSPAAGATLPTNAAGIPVSYTCPVYRTQDFGDGNPRYAREADYVVLMSDSPQLDGEGRLANPVARVTGASTAADPDTCRVALGSATTDPAPQSTPGTWYWQVSRLCAGCSPPFETGPVQAFTLVSQEKPKLTIPGRVYAGYRFIARVDAAGGAPAGTVVTLERRAGAAWRRAGTGAVTGGRALLTAVLPRGAARVRARLTVGGQRLTSAERTVRVRSASSARTTVRAGRWTGTGVTGFRVVGRSIRDLRVAVSLLCPTPGMVSPFTTQAATALVPGARIAPDGSFVAITVRGGASVRIFGRLTGTSLAGATAEMSRGGCSGTARFAARRR